MRQIFSDVFHSLINLLYPPLCLHCHSSLTQNSLIFCEECLKHFTLINPQERCPFCFSPEFSPERSVCQSCKTKKPLLNRIGSAFDYAGPAATLVKKLKYGDQPYLAEGAGAYLALQFFKLNWPMPDCIVPMPLSFARWVDRGYNQSLLLANSLGKILSRPVHNVLHRKSGGLSQAGQSYEQRHLLKSDEFSIKKNSSINDQCILLVDDVMTTGRSLSCCAEILLEGYPSSIYGLTLCRTIK